MKKVLALVLTVVLAAAAFAGCSTPAAQGSASTDPAQTATEEATGTVGASNAAADGEITIGLTLMDYNFTFFQDMLASAKMEAEAQGVKLVDVDGGGDVQQQLEGVEDMINGTKVDALILNPVDSAAISSATLQANEAKIPVVTVDVRSETGDVVAHVASNNKNIGRDAAKFALEQLKAKNGSEKGTVLVIGYDQITSVLDRTTGFMEVMAEYPDVKLIQQNPVNVNVEEAQTLMENLLQTYPEGKLDIVFGGNSTNAMGVLAATEAAGRTDFQIIGVDDDPAELAALEKGGSFAATIVQNPSEMGKLAVQIAVKAAKGETIEESEVETTLTLVTQENIAEFKKQYEENQAKLAPYMN